ncbi:hypothetical protein IQ07DRAFT_542799 [Pyrenochaeta sp. DS3sAY3a]|nr:hypothetical protein IQ07DRAFT_542799 [Pyrenochaeta sp. DS3sAY3a]
MPQPAVRALSQKELPPSVESAYYRKCIEIRRRINDIEENNDGTRLRITRLNRGIQKMRLERAFLLEQLNRHMEYNVDDSDRSSSPPPTPTDKPLRSKRSHNRKGTPPPASDPAGAPSASGLQVASPGGTQHASLLHQMNPMSSAQSTPDPARQSTSYFSTAIGATPSGTQAAAPTSPRPAVNGAPVLPPLHSLPPLQSAAPPRTAFFDPAYDEQRPTAEADAEGSRRRAYSGAEAPAADAAPQNGDTEMTDAGAYTAVNR